MATDDHHDNRYEDGENVLTVDWRGVLMETKLLYKTGNLYTGYPYGVEAERQFGSTELHGPFSSENEANTYAHKLVEDRNQIPVDGPYASVIVVKIETPSVGKHIIRKDGAYQYAE